MKGATEELSTTVIAVVAIAAIAAIFTVFLLPTLRSQIALTQACNNGPGYQTYHEGTTDLAIDCTEEGTGNDKGTWTCTYMDKDGNTAGTKNCKQK